MMAILFLMLLVTFIFAYRGNRRVALILFFLTLIFCIYWFKYHITDPININL